MLSASSALALLLVLVTASLASHSGAQGFENIRIQTQQVAPGVYMLTGRGGNIGVSVGKDGVFYTANVVFKWPKCNVQG